MSKAFDIWLSPEHIDQACIFDRDEVKLALDRDQPDFSKTSFWSFQGISFDIHVRSVELTKDKRFAYRIAPSFKCKKECKKGVWHDAISGALIDTRGMKPCI